MRSLKSLLALVAASALWPGYLCLAAFASRLGPWPRGPATFASAALQGCAAASFLMSIAMRLLAEEGWAERVLGMPRSVSKQLRALTGLIGCAAILFLIPNDLLARGTLIWRERPVPALEIRRLLVMMFEVAAFAGAAAAARPRSSLVQWLWATPERLGALGKRPRITRVVFMIAVVIPLGLDAAGFCDTARRLSLGALQFLSVLIAVAVLRAILLRSIDRDAWRWIRLKRGPALDAEVEEAAAPRDIPARLRTLTNYLMPVVGLLGVAWVWDVDWALFRFVFNQTLWTFDGSIPVTIGDLLRATLFAILSGLAWKHMSTLFAVFVFPRMTDDPGIRYAVVTLCRYAALGLGSLATLSSIHVGMEKIGVVLAALGVGLGFGLQEVVSNFVCGIILLLERPIRVGDVVTVSGTTGKVDRINIRATTIVNGDNQSMIVPNRAFITGDLVNWTLRDKVVRVAIHIKVAHGSDPDRVTELMIAIAQADPDVLATPAPSSQMEEFGDSGLVFGLYAHVPEPGLLGKVRHRLFREIQRQFKEQGIELPTQELVVKPDPDDPRRRPRPPHLGRVHHAAEHAVPRPHQAAEHLDVE